MNKPKSQPEMILAHLKSGDSITPAQAVSEYGCYRLAAVIHRLRTEHQIITIDESSINRFGVTVHFARYKLSAQQNMEHEDGKAA